MPNRSRFCECSNPKDKDEPMCDECRGMKRIRDFKVGKKDIMGKLSLDVYKCIECGVICAPGSTVCIKCYRKGVREFK